VLSGAETLARIRAQWPNLPVLLASGYRETDPAALPMADPRVATLEKPYTFEALRGAMAGLMAGAKADRAFST
jgi:DNA-binding NtrC family response regulator